MVSEVTMFRTAQGKLFEDRAEAEVAERLANLAQLLEDVGGQGWEEFSCEKAAAYLLDNYELVPKPAN